MTRYHCPRCGYILKTGVKPEFINPAPTCGGKHPGRERHIKPAKMELLDD